MPRNRTFPAALAPLLALVPLVAFAVVLLGPSSIALREDVLHEETSAAAGVTYEHGGAQHSSDLRLLRILRPTGVEHELHLGPGAESSYYPVSVEFGSSGEPRIREVRWLPDRVAVRFASGELLEVPAENFRSVR
ncbi:hypothetical protein ACL03H_06495 [Saccharopolyspora sp. MS10]|uniref:hypothetical protein n=1 Tax=Saccharopolyspora sp. MS10 TaxID=3385973 RepID=UPI0039A2843F